MEISVNKEKCTACESCVEVCPADAITVEGMAVIDKDECMLCGACVYECPEEALTLTGMEPAIPVPQTDKDENERNNYPSTMESGYTPSPSPGRRFLDEIIGFFTPGPARRSESGRGGGGGRGKGRGCRGGGGGRKGNWNR